MSPLTPQDSNNSENERQESPAEKALRKYRYAGSQRLRYDAAAKRYDQIEAAAIKNRNSAQDKADWDRYDEEAKRAKKSA
ncbi:MAG: hypothetical protein HOE62_00975 [Alphaproteobacteria bacterium]|nr:hypothetical protein [Alphaproteobacteria bacterium]MBT4016491.1 hypothetical protein [Alphaproteobacteria bacterium]MBT5158829.1 hypothetical protein [Alphaproteobacteria bacterium]MBT6387407.1 hypothetical protein [Alphaproteobacteria bacterium]